LIYGGEAATKFSWRFGAEDVESHRGQIRSLAHQERQENRGQGRSSYRVLAKEKSSGSTRPRTRYRANAIAQAQRSSTSSKKQEDVNASSK
jgi:hypothetical protein